MTDYAVFANGTFWGVWAAANEDDAIEMAANDVGTDGATDWIEAFPADDVDAIGLEV